jgi:hypothetical protein
MKKILISAICCAVLGIAFSLMSATSVSALPAETFWGDTCFVRTGPGDTDYEELNCRAHYVIKPNDEGFVEFFNYQDHGQLPADGWRPSQVMRNSYEVCYFNQTVCGIAIEVITPSGEYKSWFNGQAVN